MQFKQIARTISAGLPFVLFVSGGAYFLSQFTQSVVEARDLRTKSKTIKQFTLEEEHERMLKKLNTEYVIVPIVRPDE